MVELNENERQIIEIMKKLGATSKDKIRSMDHIAKAATGIPKPRVAQIVHQLVQKKIVKKVARTKAPGYYLIRTDI